MTPLCPVVRTPQIVDAATKAAPVAEMLFDHFRHEIYGNVNRLNAVTNEMQTIRPSIGRPATSSMGFGMLSVTGRRRVPWPPAIITATFGLGVAPIRSRKK